MNNIARKIGSPWCFDPLLFARDDAISTRRRDCSGRSRRRRSPLESGSSRCCCSASPSREATGRSSMSKERVTGQRVQSPIDQVALEGPAHRARRLVRLQTGAIVLISMAAGLLGVLAVSLPVEDRTMPLLALGVVALLGGLFIGLTDYVHGVSVTSLVQTASALRQSAAERAADLARA